MRSRGKSNGKRERVEAIRWTGLRVLQKLKAPWTGVDWAGASVSLPSPSYSAKVEGRREAQRPDSPVQVHTGSKVAGLRPISVLTCMSGHGYGVQARPPRLRGWGDWRGNSGRAVKENEQEHLDLHPSQPDPEPSPLATVLPWSRKASQVHGCN